MEKKTLLAFVLSFLVLIIWSVLFAPEPERPEVVEKEIAPERTEPAPAPPPERIVRPELPAPKVPAEIREVPVETPLYKAVFTNAGAAIKSFRLKRYHVSPEPGSPLVELVHLKENPEDFFGIRLDAPSMSEPKQQVYEVDRTDLQVNPDTGGRELTFRSTNMGDLSIIQTYRFHPETYRIDLEVTISNSGSNRVEGNLLARLTNLPSENDSYYAFTGIGLLLDGDLEEMEPDDLEEVRTFSGRIGWFAYEDEYFISAVVPENEQGSLAGSLLPSGAVKAVHTPPAVVALNPGERKSLNYTLYMGPRDLSILKQLGMQLDKAVNFGWTDIIARPLLYALRFFEKYVGNYGLAIILLTVVIKLLFWPLTHKSYRSMKEMQKLQPLMAKIREKHKNNKEQMNKELMGLYKTYKVNPMGGCLPMIIQIPVFFALFRILGSAIELRHAPFFLWINDLSAPDRLFNFPFSIPFMAPPYGIPVLTLLMGASMFIQQKMTPTPGDPTQAKVMMFLPVIFTVMFINFPSGLVLYWLVNNIISIGQQYRIIRRSD